MYLATILLYPEELPLARLQEHRWEVNVCRHGQPASTREFPTDVPDNRALPYPDFLI